MDNGRAGTGLSRRVYLHIRSNIWGMVALFVALGGVAWADAQIGASDIRDNAIHSNHIRNGNVRTADLDTAAVTGSKIANNAVGGAQVDESSLDFSFVQRRISNACPGGQAIASVGEGGAVSCTPNLQSRIAIACPSGQAIASVAENGTPDCVPVGGGGTVTGGATRINFSQGSCSSDSPPPGSPCAATLYSANGWVLTAACRGHGGFYGDMVIHVTAPAGGTVNYSWVQHQGTNAPEAVHSGFPGSGDVGPIGFTSPGSGGATGAVGTIILNAPAQTISIPIHMYGVLDNSHIYSYCEMYGTATTA